MKKIIFVTLIYVIAGILMYILLPFIHFLSGTSSSTVRLGVIIILAALTIIAIIEYFIYKNKLKRRYLYWIFSAIVFFVSSFEHAFWTEGNYHECNIVSQNMFTGKYGAKNQWGKLVVPEKYDDVVLIENSPDANIVGIIRDEGFLSDGFNKNDLYTLHIYYDSRRINRCKYITSTNSSKSIFDVIYTICKGTCFYLYYSTENIYRNEFVTDYIEKGNSNTVSPKEVTNINKGNKESNDANPPKLDYIDLGHIDVYYFTEDRWTSELGKYNLYSKQVGSDVFYYICYNHNNEIIYPVTRGHWTFRGNDYNGRANENLYLNISAWYSSSDSGNSGNTEGSSQGDGNVHITHDPQPFEVFVPCGGCNGSGICQSCNGTGQNLSYMSGYMQCGTCGGFGKCRWCGGRGGEKHIEYR